MTTASEDSARASRFVLTPYQRAEYLWRSARSVEIVHQDRVIASLPMDFVAGLRQPTCKYLKTVVSAIVEEAGPLLLDGLEQPDEAPIRSARYIFHGPETITVRPGPQGKRSQKPYDADSLDADQSTMSHSSRSSAGQNQFRLLLACRDSGFCIITKTREWDGFIPCHIIPKSRGNKLITEILGPENARIFSIDSIQNGLSLSADWHKKFDSYSCGIYTGNGEYEIHAFKSQKLLDKSFHGSLLQLRPDSEFENPRKEFLEWHYAQCIQARLREHDTFLEEL